MELFENTLNNIPSAVGTLIAAAMETIGHRLQAEMLNAVNASGGQTLAALLYLIGIITGVIIVAIGGNFKFAKYLLIGPPLFFILTQIRTHSPGVDWRFGARLQPREYVEQAIRGVGGPAPAGSNGGNVSLFFQLWNLLVTDIVQLGIELVNVTENNADLSFVSAIERYMNLHAQIQINDPMLQGFIQIALANECADYYLMQMEIANPGTNSVQRQALEERIAQRRHQTVINMPVDEALRRFSALAEWWNSLGRGRIQGGPGRNVTFTCEQLWSLAASMIARHAHELVQRLADQNRPPGLSQQEVMQRLARRFGMQVNRADGRISARQRSGAGPDQAAQGREEVALMVNEIVARTLLYNVFRQNPAFQMYSLESYAGNTYSGAEQQTQRTSRMIQQLVSTEQWQGKGDFLAGALALPYFQGLILFGLAVTYPFFAMMLVLPGRHTTFLLWMGLWAWAKSWDFGWAIVMMIDNMLYYMFPQGPQVNDEMLRNPGRAWMAILTIDPTFSAHTYYNLIATCVYAVPIVTGALVKKGGGELVHAVSQGAHQFGSKIGGAMGAYYRSLLAQTKAAQAQGAIYHGVRSQLWNALSEPGMQQEFNRLFKDNAGQGILNNFAGGGQVSKLLKDIVNQSTSADKAALLTRLDMIIQHAGYEASTTPEVRRLASEAVLQRYYTHDFSEPYPADAEMNGYLAHNYYGSGTVWNGLINRIGGRR